MKNKKINILIIGCGKMGTSHISSFLDKPKVNLYLYDKFKTKLKKYKNYRNINILDNINLKIKFNFCIVSTNSKERFKIFKKLALQKKIEIFLLEKFMFLNKKHFSYVKKNFDVKKIFNNVWGKYLYRKSIKYNLKSYDKVKVLNRKGHLLTNLIHFINFFSYYQKYQKVNKFNLKPIKFKKVDEFSGNLNIQYDKQKIIFETKNIKNLFEMYFNKTNKKGVFKIILKKDYKLCFYLNLKLVKVIKFPLASSFSYKIFKRNSHVPNFSEILDDNLNILNMSKMFSKKKMIKIR